MRTNLKPFTGPLRGIKVLETALKFKPCIQALSTKVDEHA